MANFSADELQSVIDRLIRSSIRRPYDTLGVRRTDVTFSDIQEAAAGVFLLFQRSPYYFAFLGTQRLEADVAVVEGQINELMSLVGVLRRRVVPVRDVSSLANARAALFELESAVSRNGPPRDVAKVPAFQRFNSNIDRFLGAVGQNIKANGAIVPTPQEARGRLPAEVQRLQAAMDLLTDRVQYVSRAIENYGSINLPALVSGGVISRARQMLEDRIEELQGMDEFQRLEVLRDTVLECLGTKAVVKRFGSFSPPAGISYLTGTGTPFSDADRPANEAFIDADKNGPYALIAALNPETSSNVLSLWVDGAPSYPSPPSTQVYLPPSITASLSGTRNGPFNIQAGVNDQLLVNYDGFDLVVTIGSGVGRTAVQVAADIAGDLTGTNFTAEAYFAPLMYDGEVLTSGNNLTLAFGKFPPNSVKVGDEVDFYFGDNTGITRTVTAVSPSLASPETITVSGAVLVSGTSRVRYGSADRMIRIVVEDKAYALANRQTLMLKTPTELEQNTGITLGFYGALISYSRPTDAQIVADYVTQNNTKVRAEVLPDVMWEEAELRSVPTDSFGMVFTQYKGMATWQSGTSNVPVVLETLPLDTPGLVGKALVLREAPEPDMVGTVTSQDPSDLRSLTVTFSGPVTAATGVVEAGVPSGIEPGMVVNVLGGPNGGKYYVDAVHPTIPFQFKLRSILPVFKDGFSAPTLMVGHITREGLRFFSKTINLTSKIELRDPTSVFMSTPGPHAAVGTTQFMKLPSKPVDLEAGDYIEFFTTALEFAEYERVISQLYSDAVVRLDGTIPSDSSWPFNVSTLPTAKLRTDKVVSFEEYAAKLRAWLTLPNAIVRRYFLDLNRFIQPLLVNQNPTDSDIGSAENKLNELRGILSIAGAQETSSDIAACLETILGSYESPYVAEADALVRSFQEKGADRAVDALLDCRFTDFFGYDQDELSYAGNFQKTTREVAVNDLPIRKTDRLARTQSPLIGSAQSVDYEIESPDLDPTPNIDPPTDIG